MTPEAYNQARSSFKPDFGRFEEYGSIFIPGVSLGKRLLAYPNEDPRVFGSVLTLGSIIDAASDNGTLVRGSISDIGMRFDVQGLPITERIGMTPEELRLNKRRESGFKINFSPNGKSEIFVVTYNMITMEGDDPANRLNSVLSELTEQQRDALILGVVN